MYIVNITRPDTAKSELPGVLGAQIAVGHSEARGYEEGADELVITHFPEQTVQV